MKRFACAIAFSLFASAAYAAPAAEDDHHDDAEHHAATPGLGDRVFSADVIGDELEIALRAARVEGGENEGEHAVVAEFGYGFTDKLYAALLMVGGAGALHDQFDLRAVALEGVYEIGALPGGVDVALYGEFAADLQDDDAVAFKALFSRQTERFDGRLNLGVHRSLGEDHTTYGYGAATMFNVADGFQLGLQAFGDIGDQDSFGGRRAHYLGPVAGLRIMPVGSSAELDIEAGYLFALGEAQESSDGQARVLVALKRHLGAGGHGGETHAAPAAHGGHGGEAHPAPQH